MVNLSPVILLQKKSFFSQAAEAVTVSISKDAKMQILKDTLKQLKQHLPHIEDSKICPSLCLTTKHDQIGYTDMLGGGGTGW